MPTKYLVLPSGPFPVIDCVTGEQAIQEQPRAGAGKPYDPISLRRIVFSYVASAVAKDKLDDFEADDLRTKLLCQSPIEVTEKEHAALEAEAKGCRFFDLHERGSIMAVNRAIADAHTTRPES